jgi:uncharacterized Fe-S cluster-containing protein
MSVSIQLPGLDCGLCGVATCTEFQERLTSTPDLIKRCVHLDTGAQASTQLRIVDNPTSCSTGGCGSPLRAQQPRALIDSLGREFDFVLQHFPEEPGPREIIIPHNPMLTREMHIQKGDVMIGRPLGMSCGCPVTHCGEVTDVDARTGVITWCVTGPLRPRAEGFKDIGYYIAEAYEGLVQSSRQEIKIGMRYFFQPDMCMLQWRHSGLINYLNRTTQGLQVRVEGLWIG